MQPEAAQEVHNATQSLAALLVFGLAIGSTWWLAVKRPKRIVAIGTPYDIPKPAFIAALVFIALAAMNFAVAKQPRSEIKLSRAALWVLCAEGLLELTIVGTTYVLPRRRQVAIETATVDHPVLSETHADSPAPEPLPLSGSESTAHRSWLARIMLGAAVGFALLFPTGLMGLLLQRSQNPEDMHVLLKALSSGGWDYLTPIVISAVFLAPLKEELIFRIVLQGWLADRFGRKAIIASSLIFAAVHGFPDALQLLPLSFALGILFDARRSYVENVAAHAAFNGAMIFMQVVLVKA